MKTRRIAVLLLLSLLPSTVSLPASAQAEDPVTMQARARFKEGVDFYDKGQYENARLAFLQAYALKKHPAVLLNLAQSSSKANHPLEAAKYFQQFLRDANASPAQQRDAESGLAEVRQRLGRIEIIAPAGTEITLDDKDKLGVTPFPEPIDVEVGSHTVRSSTETVRVIATAGQKVQARFGNGGSAPVIAPVPTPPPPQPEPVAPLPARDSSPSPLTDNPPEGKNTSLLSPPATMAPVYIGLVAAGLGAAGAIVFAVFKADAQSDADSVAANIRAGAAARNLPAQGICSRKDEATANAFRGSCATLNDNNAKVDTNATIANVSLVVMGVGLLTAGGWYLFGPKKGAEPTTGSAPSITRPIIVPYASWGNAGLSFSGSF